MYRQVTLHIAKVNPQGAAYAFVNGVLVIGNIPSVKKLIDARGQRPLSANAAFRKVRQKLAAPKSITAYLNVKRVLTDLRPQLDANPEMARKLDDLGATKASNGSLSPRRSTDAASATRRTSTRGRERSAWPGCSPR